MNGFKLSSFSIFLITLIILVIFVALYNYLSSEKEGFTQNDNEILDYYPNASVNKLYTNIFFDTTNGIIIEKSPAQKMIWLTNRDGVSKMYDTPITAAIIASFPKVTSSYTSWVYKSQSIDIDNCFVCYMPWGTYTYVHVLNKNMPAEMYTYLFSNTGDYNHSVTTVSALISNAGAATDSNDNKMVSKSAYSATKEVFQVSKTAAYDISSGELILDVSSGVIVYDKQNNSTTYNAARAKIGSTTGNITADVFSPWAVLDNTGKNVVLYMPHMTKTMVSILQLDSDANISLGNVCRFTTSGLDTNTAKIIKLTAPTIASSEDKTVKGGKPASKNMAMAFNEDGVSVTVPNEFLFNYFSMFMQPGMMGGKSNILADQQEDMYSNYMLKTQFVPPVCPSCPACATGGSCGAVCTNCGGQGGSGTLTCNGSSVIDASGNVVLDKNGKPMACSAPAGTAVSSSTGGVANNLISTTGDVLKSTGAGATGLAKETVSGATGLAKETVSGATGLVKDTASGATGLAKETVSGATGLAKETVSGATGLAKETVSGATGLAKETVSGATGLLKDTASGLSQFLTANRANLNQSQYQGVNAGGATVASAGAQFSGAVTRPGSYPPNLGTNTQHTDLYSYYGALPDRPANYIPITANFSSFGK